MSEYRPVKTKMWHDNWFLSLSPEEKLLWSFLLTNEYTHISGIYELPKLLISPLTGIIEPLKILEKFQNDGKIIYKNEWIFLKNYLNLNSKQISKKDNITKSIIAYLSENSFLISLFELEKETPYKPLIRPLCKEESNKDESIKEESNKEPKKNSRFTPPTLEEVINYCKERNNSVDPQRFINFYESKGWMVGKNKMKDWRASVRTWELDKKDTKPKDVSERRIL
jgi:hypothetical protein